MVLLTLFIFRCYTDRKKKIIREWNKNNTSPRASDALGGAGDPLRTHPYMGDFLSHGYPAPYGVKDEPLRPDYYSAYAAYGAESEFYRVKGRIRSCGFLRILTYII